MTFDPLRVLLVNHTAVFGGAEHSLLELARALPEQGVAPLVALPAGALADALRALPEVTVRTLPLRVPPRPRGPRAAVRAGWGYAVDAARLARLCRAARPALVHANSARAAWAAVPAARLTRRPCVWHCRDLAPPGARQLVRRCARTVAISAAVVRSLPRSPKVALIPNGIDLERYDPARYDRAALRAQMGLAEGQRLLLMVADLVPWKRHELFLEVAAALRRASPGLIFAIAGRNRGEHPELAARLQARAAALELGAAVRWLGSCPDTAPLFAAADLLVHPPATEPFGRAVCEALAMNVPVVVADAGGPAEWTGDVAAVRRATAGDAASFAAAALDALGSGTPPPSRPFVVARHDVRRVAAELATLWRAVVRSRT